MSFTLFKIVRTRNSRIEGFLERIAIAQERIAGATERLAPAIIEGHGDIEIVEITKVQDAFSEQEKLDNQPIPEY